MKKSQNPPVPRPDAVGLPGCVFFREAGKPAPRWMRVLKPGFRHCGLVVEVGHSLSLVIESSHWGVALVPAPAGAADDVLDLLDATRVLPVNLVHPFALTNGPPMPPALFTCVELVKRTLGIRDRFVQTPYQLYRRLGGTDAQ